MATTILLVRHGQTNHNKVRFITGWGEEDLNDTGYEQARKLSKRLAGSPISSIYSSPLKRTLSTARTIAEPHGLELQILDDLIEVNLGDWQGQYDEDVRKKWPELREQSLLDPSNISIPNGESFDQLTERSIRALETVLSANPDGQVIIVTHDAVIRVLVAHVLEVSNSIYRKIEINNASLTVVGIGFGKKQLLTLNDTSHL